MKLIETPIDQAQNGLLAHSHTLPQGRIPKGRHLSKADIEKLREAGVDKVRIALAEDGDIAENEAAAAIAAALKMTDVTCGTAATGRVNIHADKLGILRYDRDLLTALNMVDEAITISLVAHNQLLAEGDMLATIKIIPFYVTKTSVAEIIRMLTDRSFWQFHPITTRTSCLVQTRLPRQPDRLFENTKKVTEKRLAMLGCKLGASYELAHETAPLAAQLNKLGKDSQDIIFIAGASAITDRSDIIPAAIEQAGGRILHFGLPVDPGNLLLLAQLNDKLVIGLPGCARSPKLNGLDWVLQLHLAGIELSDSELAEMAAGGLLMEIISRPMPRLLTHGDEAGMSCAGLLLAAGRSTRMSAGHPESNLNALSDETVNKLLADMGGKPMVRQIAETMLASDLGTLYVVVGHQAERVSAALGGLPVRLIFNPDYRLGQSTSLRAGLAAIDDKYTDLMVMLGDMPLISDTLINQLLTAHEAGPEQTQQKRSSRITCPTFDSQQGHPVIWGRSFFAELSKMKGDQGGKPLFEQYPDALQSIPVLDDAVLKDADTPSMLADIRSRFSR